MASSLPPAPTVIRIGRVKNAPKQIKSKLYHKKNIKIGKKKTTLLMVIDKKLSKNQFDDLLAVIRQLANKNIQFQYELSQMTREHKSVVVNETEGTKQCPECHTNNPIDAMYCRKCATSFWITKPAAIPRTKNNKKRSVTSQNSNLTTYSLKE